MSGEYLTFLCFSVSWGRFCKDFYDFLCGIQIFGIYTHSMTVPLEAVSEDLRLLLGYGLEWQHEKRAERFS